MYIEPVKKVNKLNKSRDKKQRQHGKQDSPRSFLGKFTQKLNKFRKRKITRNKQKTKQKQYKSKELHEELYRREVEKNKTYSKVYNTLNGKKDIKRNKQPSTRYRNNGRKAYSSTIESQYIGSTSSGKNYDSRNTSSTRSGNTTKNTYNNSQKQVRKAARPKSSISSKNTQTDKARKQKQVSKIARPKSNISSKNSKTDKTRKQKVTTPPKARANSSTSTKTNTSKEKYSSSTVQNLQQLMKSAQKQTTGKAIQHRTTSIEKMLGEYNQAYRKTKGVTQTTTKQKGGKVAQQTRVGRQPLTKKDEVKQFKKGIAATKKTTNDIAYMEYQKSLSKRAAMQSRMSNKGRER